MEEAVVVADVEVSVAAGEDQEVPPPDLVRGVLPQDGGAAAVV